MEWKILKTKKSWDNYVLWQKNRVFPLPIIEIGGKPEKFPCLVISYISPAERGIYSINYTFLYKKDLCGLL